MKILLPLLIILCIFGCTKPEKSSSITEDQVKATIEGFFYSFNVENDDPNLMDRYVTKDFIIYEASQKMTQQDFEDLVGDMNNVSKTEWILSDYRITIDQNTAHASLFNEGTFIFKGDTSNVEMKAEWLESAFLVMENDSLKIKFYFSDNILREFNPIQE